VLDRAFIEAHCIGFDAWVQSVRATPWPALAHSSRLSEASLRDVAQVFATAERVIFCWGMGLTQHRNAVPTIQSLTNLLLVRGHIGKPGAGACPVRGHSNVQGDRTMGIWEKPPAALLDRLEAVFGFAAPRAPGFDTIESIHAMRDGRGKVFIALGGNFAAAAPDTAVTTQALRQCALTVQISTKLNRSHLAHGRDALILPCLGRTETDRNAHGPQAVTVEDSMSMVHASAGMNPPASPHLLSEPAIVARMAHATLGQRSQVPWLQWAGDYAAVRDAIERVFDDFAGFNEKIAQPGGFHLRNAAREREWRTASGKATLYAHALPDLDTPERTFTLMTMRSHDQYNTTVYGLDDRYRGVFGQRRVVFIHTDDLAALGLQAGDWVDIETAWGEDALERRAAGFKLVAYRIPRGNLAAYYPETNALVPLDSGDAAVGTPASKSIPVRLVRAALAPA
jgi:molybdopterin-dependent oxidoreductase alpha subunit